MTSTSAAWVRTRRRPLAMLAVLGLAIAAFLTTGSAATRIGALPPCGAEMPIPGHPGETYEVLCPEPVELPDEPTWPGEFEEDPGPGWPNIPPCQSNCGPDPVEVPDLPPWPGDDESGQNLKTPTSKDTVPPVTKGA
ncbi:hypothetical protein GCM10009555_007280 [Acrocarpospora macrocephala]|uniref:Uncharacterized protein n=1 Tax=Acrocarpospora macrocephala TaxID=150177 RepID=A0A5M3WUX1_9ACTN|nr:hypothetical protein [Acrocarpospora macrocephala]GES13195.1 hypothetical protein Amac_067920 [Acrocarpospora macrocephala]